MLLVDETVTPVAPVIWVTVAPEPPDSTWAAPEVEVTSLTLIEPVVVLSVTVEPTAASTTRLPLDRLSRTLPAASIEALVAVERLLILIRASAAARRLESAAVLLGRRRRSRRSTPSRG